MHPPQQEERDNGKMQTSTFAIAVQGKGMTKEGGLVQRQAPQGLEIFFPPKTQMWSNYSWIQDPRKEQEMQQLTSEETNTTPCSQKVSKQTI